MKLDEKFNPAKLTQAGIITVVFWIIAVILWQVTDNIFLLFNFGYIGTSIGVGMGLYSTLPRSKKHWGRRFAQLLVGLYMLGFLGLYSRENMQIEGFFFYLMSGAFAGSVIHYLVAKISGPLIYNRGWCGWACWTAMILDFLPFRKNKRGRLNKKWGNLRYLHFFLSLVTVLILWIVYGYRVEENSKIALYWLLAGNAFYYISSIMMAFILKDNRAFCKYLCPIPTIQKIPTKFSMLKVDGDAEECLDCGACSKACPMDIRIHEYIKNGQRVLSTECVLCLECINVCPKGILDTTFKFDVGNKELINYRNAEKWQETWNEVKKKKHHTKKMR